MAKLRRREWGIATRFARVIPFQRFADEDEREIIPLRLEKKKKNMIAAKTKKIRAVPTADFTGLWRAKKETRRSNWQSAYNWLLINERAESVGSLIAIFTASSNYWVNTRNPRVNTSFEREKKGGRKGGGAAYGQAMQVLHGLSKLDSLVEILEHNAAIFIRLLCLTSSRSSLSPLPRVASLIFTRDREIGMCHVFTQLQQRIYTSRISR